MASELHRFVFYGEWLENIKDMPIETQDKIIADIVRYGVDVEQVHEDDSMVKMAVNFTKGAIDASKNNYQAKIDAGNQYGRKKAFRDQDVYDLYQENTSRSSQTIAGILGVSKSAIDHSEGWRRRKEIGVVFE